MVSVLLNNQSTRTFQNGTYSYLVDDEVDFLLVSRSFLNFLRFLSFMSAFELGRESEGGLRASLDVALTARKPDDIFYG